MIVFMLMLGLLVILILAKAINSIVVVVSFISVKLTSCPHGKKKKKEKKEKKKNFIFVKKQITSLLL